MTAGELVVNIVLKGGEKAKETFEGLNKGVKSVASSSLEAKAALVGAVYALDRLISSAGQQGSTLTQFINLTGQSAEALQRWKLAFQHTGGAAEDMQGSIQSVYQALVKQNAGLGTIAGFGFVNNAMNMDMSKVRKNDVFYVMDQLKQFANSARGMSGIGTDMMKTFGLSDSVISGLRNKDFDPSKVSKGLIIGDAEREKLNRMNMSLNDFWQSLKRFGTSETEIFGPTVVQNLNAALHTIEKLTAAFNKMTGMQKGLGVIVGLITTMAVQFAIMGGPLTALTAAIGGLIWLAAQWDKHAKGQENIFGDKNFKGNIGEKTWGALKGGFSGKDKEGFWHDFFHDQNYQPSKEDLDRIQKDMENSWLYKAIHGDKKSQPENQNLPTKPGGKGASINIHNYGVEDDTLGMTVMDSINRHAVRRPVLPERQPDTGDLMAGSPLSNIANVAQALSGLVLVSPQKTIGYQPQLAPSVLLNTFPYGGQSQPSALLFHYEGENTALLRSDITDEFIETNSAVNDMIALPPEEITVRGYIGELNNVAPIGNAVISQLKNNLTAISGYEPKLTQQALNAYNTAFFLYQVAASAVSSAVQTWSSLTGSGGESVINGNGLQSQKNQSAQQAMFQQFYGYWRQRQLFTVQTPWAVFQDMAIKTLRAVQEEDTNEISSFEVTFKLMRFAQAVTTQNATAVTTDYNDVSGRLQNQSQPSVDLGTQTLTPSSTSMGDLTSAVA